MTSRREFADEGTGELVKWIITVNSNESDQTLCVFVTFDPVESNFLLVPGW